MFKNYFKIAWRNLQRNKVYSFINIAGLSMGLACAMLILLYVKDEVSFDRFHKNVVIFTALFRKPNKMAKSIKVATPVFCKGRDLRKIFPE